MTKKKTNGPPISSGPLEPITDITAENWYERAKQWIELGHGFFIVQDDEAEQPPGSHYPVSQNEWAAWVAYFKHAFHHRGFHTRRHMPIWMLDAKGCGTMPSRWPHEFDATWNESQSWAAVDSYQAELRQIPMLRDPKSPTGFKRMRYRDWKLSKSYKNAPPFRPFPKLWETFADEPDIIAKLDNAPSFLFLEEASRLNATRGKDVARGHIEDRWHPPEAGLPRMPGRYTPPPAPPLDPVIKDKLDTGTWSADDLKTPPKPASEELKRLLHDSKGL